MPYLTGGLAVVLDGLLGTGWLIAGVTLVDHTFARTVPGPYTRWLMTFFALGWLPHMTLLGLTLVRVPNERRSMLILGGVLLACVVIGILAPLVPGFQAVSGVITQLLMVSVFSYLLVGRRVFDTTKVAIEQALESTSEAVIVLGLNEQVLYANQAADTLLEVKSRHRRGGAALLLDVPALRSLIQHKHGEQMLEIRGRTVVVSSNPITTTANDVQGYLLQVRDITDAHASHLALQQREHDLRQTITALEQAQDSQQRLTTTIRGLTLPMIPVMDGVIVVPLIGEFDHQRAIEFSQQLLCGIEAQRARTVVLDLTGMSLMDQRMAQMLMDVVNAARLLGAATTLVGIRPDIAQAIVALGNEFGRLDTAASLHAALTTRSLPGRTTSR
jgi:anti-anti-sigma regulatory factor/PAS domain-containing protein